MNPSDPAPATGPASPVFRDLPPGRPAFPAGTSACFAAACAALILAPWPGAASPREGLPKPAPIPRQDGPHGTPFRGHGPHGGSALGGDRAGFRSIDGSGNNLSHPGWGAAALPLLRDIAPEYADGTDAPAGPGRPNARVVSNAIAAQSGPLPNAKRRTDYLWQWGQFLDHDVVETATATPPEPFPIAVPAGDPWFDPFGTGAVLMALNRSAYVRDAQGVRQQINQITSFIDASNVYGSDPVRAEALRENDGSGRLKTSEGDLLPFNQAMLPNAPGPSAAFFLAGDVRANEQVGLTCMHTLFVREHNHWADRLRGADPTLSGDAIYELARHIVAAEMQAITYNEFLPALLGPNALAPYRGYRPDVDPTVSNVFATGAYRLGHSMLSASLLRVDAGWRMTEAGPLALADAFFAPHEVIEHGIDPVLRGLAAQVCQEIDNQVVDDVRNFLFGPPGAGGFDLSALNIQRGRDHGLPSYNATRRALGLTPASTFADINPDSSGPARLAEVYASVEDIDLWVGGLCEPHVRGAMVGETFFALLKDQFERLRDGDRFFYRGDLPPQLARMIDRQTLATIIRRNTGIGRELQGNVFQFRTGPKPERPTPRKPRP